MFTENLVVQCLFVFSPPYFGFSTVSLCCLVFSFRQGGVGEVMVFFRLSGVIVSRIDLTLFLKLSTIKSHEAGKMSAGVSGKKDLQHLQSLH